MKEYKMYGAKTMKQIRKEMRARKWHRFWIDVAEFFSYFQATNKTYE